MGKKRIKVEKKMAMKKENKKLWVGVISTLLVMALFTGGFFGGKAMSWWGGTDEADTAATNLPPIVNPINQPQAPVLTTQPGLIYVDLSGNLMDKAKFATDSSNAYSGIPTQAVKFFDITKNPQNDPRTNNLAVNDFQIVASSSTNGLLSGTKKGIAGHTYVYYFENTTGTYYDITGTFTIPANINAFAPAFDFGNLLAPKVGTIAVYNSTDQTDNGATLVHANLTIAGTTASTEVKVQVGSQSYADFVRIWGEWDSEKTYVLGVSVVQKAGPSTGITIDSSDAKNPIITINELTAMYPITFTYYFQGAAAVTLSPTYNLNVDDWNAVPGKFATKVDSNIGLGS